MSRVLFAVLALLAAGALQASEQGKPFYGYAYDLDSGKYLYTEVHDPVFEGGKQVGSRVRYVAPDGSLLGTKSIDYRPDCFVPVFRTELLKEGYVEAVLSSGANIDMLRVEGRDKPEKRKSVKKEGLMAADAGFHCLLQAKLPALIAGEKISFRFAVAGQLDTFRFEARKVGEASFEGRKAVKLLIEPDSLLRYIAPDLEMLYDPVSRDLYEFRGISNLHDPKTGSAYMARIAYYRVPPPDAPKNLPPLPR